MSLAIQVKDAKWGNFTEMKRANLLAFSAMENKSGYIKRAGSDVHQQQWIIFSIGRICVARKLCCNFRIKVYAVIGELGSSVFHGLGQPYKPLDQHPRDRLPRINGAN